MYQLPLETIIGQFDLLGITPHTLPNAIGLWPNEQECLVWAASQCDQNKDWVEVGSFCGGSTILLGLTKEFWSNTGKVIAIDSNFNPMFDLNIRRSKLSNITKIQCESEDLLDHYCPVDDTVSFAFLDGWHSFRSIIREWENLYGTLTDDAIIAFHDVSPLMHTHNQEYIDLCRKAVSIDWYKLMDDQTQNFRIDEAIAFLCQDWGYEIIDIPVRTDETHFQETGLTEWVRGETSPHNAFTAIRKKK